MLEQSGVGGGQLSGQGWGVGVPVGDFWSVLGSELQKTHEVIALVVPVPKQCCPTKNVVFLVPCGHFWKKPTQLSTGILYYGTFVCRKVCM